MSGCVVVGVTGEIDMSNADDLAAAIRSHVTNQAAGVIVDLTNVRFIDSSGLAVLFALARRLKSSRQQLRVVAPRGSHVRAVIDLVDLRSQAEIDESVTAAAENLCDGLPGA